MTALRIPLLALAAACCAAAGCGSNGGTSTGDGGSDDGSSLDGASGDSAVSPTGEGGADSGAAGDAAGDAHHPGDASGVDAGPCTTTVTYGRAWISGGNHPAQFDVASGDVTWDGTCTNDSSGNSYAVLSNGWKPYFTGPSACILALDTSAGCGKAPACATRVSYGAGWLPPANHPATYDDLPGRAFSDGACTNAGSDSYANLSNGWQPHFSGHGTCALSFRYTECRGLYWNPVIPHDCPDPGVLAEGGKYYLSCTSGGAANAYPIYTSTDLATWTQVGHIFPSGHWPTWATGDFWAPEIHHVGSHYVAYFSARHTNGQLSVGAASATSPLGPFTDVGAPLVNDANMGHIDASEINDPNGTPYALWKDDGNALGLPTPIHGQQLAPDGLSLVGSAKTLITNDQGWEGAVTEGPFMVDHGGTFYLFYSGNSYASTAYAIGVAKASSPLGPFTKAGGPILTTGGAWAGPGHCSVVDTPGGDTTMIYHAWQAGAVGGGPGREVLVDTVDWSGAWPAVPLSPSSTTRPLP